MVKNKIPGTVWEIKSSVPTQGRVSERQVVSEPYSDGEE